MKELKAVVRYKCDFCNKKSVKPETMARHEIICYKNPNRDCDVCSNEGVEFIHGVGANLGFIPEVDEKDCIACLNAQRVGGKSYITRKDGETK